MKKALFLAGLLVFLAGGVWGQTYTWTGVGAIGAWDDEDNWLNTSTGFSGDGYPGESGSGDTAIFNASPSGTVTISGMISPLNALTIDSGVTLILDTGGNVNNLGDVTVANTASLILYNDLDCKDLDNAGTLNLGANDLSATSITNAETLNLDGATGQTVTPTIVGGTGTVVFGNNGDSLAGITSFTNVTINDGSRTGGALTVTGDFVQTGGTLTATSLNKTGGTMRAVNIEAPVTINGTVTASGVIIITGTETLTVITGQNFDMVSYNLTVPTVNDYGTINSGSGNTVNIGTLNLFNGSTFDSGGDNRIIPTVNITGTSTVQGLFGGVGTVAVGDLNLNGGSLSATGTGTLTFGGGTVTANAAISISPVTGNTGTLDGDSRPITIETAGAANKTIGAITSTGDVTINAGGTGNETIGSIDTGSGVVIIGTVGVSGTVAIGTITTSGTKTLSADGGASVGTPKIINTGGQNFNNVTIETGSFIQLAINDLSATNLTIDGTLIGNGRAFTVTNLTINSVGELTHGTGTITINGGTWDNSNGGTYTAGNGMVTFDGATVNGNNGFINVTCTGIVSFESGSRQTFPATGTLDASGATLKAIGTSNWEIAGLVATNFTTDTSTIIERCTSVTELLGRTAGNANATGSSNNIRVFTGGTFYWIGGVNGSWENNNNWSATEGGLASYFPDPFDTTSEIIIPVASSYGNPLTLNLDVFCDSLDIAGTAVVDLDSCDLTVTSTFLNGGLVQLVGSQDITVGGSPPSTVGGTIQYQGATPAASWPFGYAYNNLTIDGTATMGITPGALTVNGTATINANIETTGNQSYNILALGGASHTLTSTGGNVNATGIVSGSAGVIVNALQGITIDNPANTLSGNITLNNNQTGTPTNSVSFTTTTNPITVSGTNPSTPGNFTVVSSGNITLGSGGIDATGTITLISTNGAVSGTGVLTGTNLTVNAHSGISLGTSGAVVSNQISGNVELNNNSGTPPNTGNISFTNASGSINLTTVNDSPSTPTPGEIYVYNDGVITVLGASTNSGQIDLIGTAGINGSGIINTDDGTATAAIILRSNDGDVSLTGVLTGTNLTVNSHSGISLGTSGTPVNNQISGNVVLNNNIVTLADNTGNISFTNTATEPINVTAVNGAPSADPQRAIYISHGGTINITTSGVSTNSGQIDLLGTAGITGSGSINTGAGAAINLTSSGGAVNESGILTGTALTVNANAGIILEGNNLINGTASLNNTTGLPLAGDISFNNTISTGTLQLTAANNTANGNIGVTNKNPLTTGVIIAGSVGSRGNVDITNENTIIVNGNITADEVTLITDNDSGDLINNITISDDISGIVSKLTIISGDLYGAYDYCGTVTISNPITLTDGAAEIEISAGVITGSGNLSAAGGVSFLLDEFNTYTGSISDSFSIGPRHRADLIYYTTLPSLLGTHLPADAVQVSSSAYSGDFNFTDFTNVYLVNVSDSNVGRTVTVNASGIIEFYDSYTYNPVTPSPNPHLNLTGNGGIRTYHPDTITPGTTVININTPFTTNTPLDATQPLTISAGHLLISANGIILGGNVNGAPASAHNLLLDTTRAAGYAINVVGNIGNVNPLGNIEVRSINPSNTTTPTISWGVYFGGTITARSYKQTGTGGTGGNGSTYINGTQSYNPVSGNAFEFEGYDLTVISTMGTTGTPIGPILINNANVVQFDDEIWAGSFTQSAANITTGATSFDSTQTYSGNFTFTGRVLNVNNSLNTGGDITITNSGTFTKGVSTTQHIVATGVFLQNGAGENTIGANITASAITFSNLVELSANAVFATTGNGNIVLSGNSTGTVATADTSGADRNLTLTAAGTGTITLGSPSAPSTGNTVDLGTGTLTVTASTVTTAAAVPLNIGTGITTATNLTINNGTSFDPKEVLTVWGDTTNNGTINAATPSSGNDSIFFNGDYNGSSGTIVDTGNSNRIVFNGEIAAVGTFNNTTDTLVLKGQYTPSGTDQEFSHNTSTPLYIVRIENRNSTSTGINTVRLESDVVQTDNGTGGELYFDMTPNTSAGPKLYTTANYTWRMGTGTPPTTPSPPAPFGYGFVNYKGEVVFDPGSELHTQDFLAPQTGSPSPYTYTFNGPASIWAAGNVDIRDDNPGNVFITTAPDELNIFTLVMNGGGSVQSLHCEQIGSTSHAAIGSLRLTGSAQVRIINSIEIQGDVLIEPGTTLFAGYPGNSITIHVTGYHNPAAKIDRGANWFQTLPVVVDPGPPEEVVLGIGPSGTFVPYNSTVEFGSKTSTIPPSWDGRTFRISGNTTWYNLFCYEPKADLLFSNYGVTDLHEHTIHNRFEVEPRRANGDLYGSAGDITNMIKISRLTFTQLTPVTNNVIGIYGPPTIPNNDFWYFRLGPGAELFFNFVFLNYSYSQRRIPLPYGDPAQFLVIATPYYNRDPDNSNLYDPRVPGGNLITAGEYSYYNVNWFVANNFFYSFTEDSTGNGKIDRIRAQAAFELMDGSDTSPETGYEAFQYFKVIVDGYEIDTSRGYNNTGYDRVPGATDCIYIYVKEKPSSDGGETPTWRIERNQSLMDATTKSIFIGEPAHGDHQTSDTVPPRINYAFALPGHTEQFFQLSELVNNGDITSSINSGTLTPLGRGEFLVDISAYDLNQLVTGNESFDLDNVRDRAGFIRDRRSEPGVLYAYQYPSPKYPKDWDYSDYIEVRGWYDQVNMGNSVSFMPITNDPGDLPPIREWYYDAANPNNSSYPSYSSSFVGPDPKLGNRMFGKTNGLTAAAADYGKGRHRVTDMLISIPPNNLGDTAQHDYFFIWPLWAKYASEGSNLDDLLGNTLHPGYGYMGHDGSNIIDSSIIWDFTGKRFLERDDIVMQSRISDGFSAAVSPVTIFYNTGPSDYYRATTVHGSVGLWHPYQGLLTPPLSKSYIEFFNMVPYTFPNKNSPSPDDVGNNLFNHSFDKSYFPGNATVEFYYHLDVSDENLLAARLDVPPGTDPSTLKGQPWYRWVRPFTFGIHDITRQRGGVTILNNVINSNNRERVYVDYKPESSGRVTIQVFTLDGNLVKILKRGSETADGKYHRVSWDGTNEGGRPVARGMYFIRVVAPGIDEIRKVMVVK